MIWLVDFSVKAGLLLGTAWVAALLLRRSSADVRHSLWLAALVGVAILALPLQVPKPVQIAAPLQFAVTSLSGSIQASDGAWSWLRWPALWITGMVLVFGRLLAGIATVAFWTRKARPVGQAMLSPASGCEVAPRRATRSPVPLVSDHAATPLTWGFFRPVILFPAYATQWTAEQRELALRHEQAHIVRHDWLWQMLANTINAVFWFHPLVWLANAEMRREAEGAADDLVLASGADASDYAGQLVLVARHITGAALLGAVPMARSKVLESRVREILDPLRHRSRASTLTRAGVAALACACLVPLLAMPEASVLTGNGVKGPKVASGSADSTGVAAAGASVRAAEVRRAFTEPARPNGGVPKPSVAGGDAGAGARVNDGDRVEDAAIHRLGEPGMQPPRLIYKQEPGYTEDARVAKIQGTVMLRVVIDEQGRAEDIQVTRSVDAGLDEKAIQAVQRWQFTPALKDGEPVRVMAFIEVNFRLL